MQGEKPLAFVIEDEPELNEIFSGAIQAAGYEVESLLDGQAAMERCQNALPVLVILDLHLPHISGEKILNKIRELRGTEVFVVLSTADAQLADSIREDADLVLLKPISFHQLKDLAQRLYPNPD